MATKEQIKALSDSNLASGKPGGILASEHREVNDSFLDGESTLGTGLNILFDTPYGRSYNEQGPLAGGNLTLDDTGALVGAEARVFFNGTAAPTETPSPVVVGGTFQTGQINVFVYKWNGTDFERNIISNLDNKANKANPSTNNNFAALFASGDIKDSGIEAVDSGNGDNFLDDTGNYSSVPASQGGYSLRRNASTNTSTPPANGQIRWDNSTQISATKIYTSFTEPGGTDQKNAIQSLLKGANQLIVQQRTDSDNVQVWQIDDSTDQGTYTELDVTLIDGSAQFTNSQQLLLTALVNGKEFIPVIDTPTSGNLSQQTASGTLVDSGIASFNVVLKDTAQTDWIGGLIESPSDKDYNIILKAPYAGTITDTTTICTSGTCTATFKINGTPLGGTANSVSSTEQSQAHASANTFSAGDDIVMTISTNSSTVDMRFTVTFTYNLQ